MSNIQQDMIEQTLAILASMMQQVAGAEVLLAAPPSGEPGGANDVPPLVLDLN